LAKATRATAALTQAGIDFALHAYEYDPDVDRIGLAAAEALGANPARVLKTLMVLADGKPACVILPSDREIAMKKLAAALGAKSAAMMPPAQAEKLSGYKVGGISPFGQMRRVPVAIEASAMDWPRVFINGGQRGLQVELSPADVVRLLGAVVAPVIA